MNRRLSPVEKLERRSMMAGDSVVFVEFSKDCCVEEPEVTLEVAPWFWDADASIVATPVETCGLETLVDASTPLALECGFVNEERLNPSCAPWSIPEWWRADDHVINVADDFDDADPMAVEHVVCEAGLAWGMATEISDATAECLAATAGGAEGVVVDAPLGRTPAAALSSTYARIFAAYAAAQEQGGVEEVFSKASVGRRGFRRAT